MAVGGVTEAVDVTAAVSDLETDSSQRGQVITGEQRVEFRIEAFNLLNRTNFRAPNIDRRTAAFGTIRETYDPRQLQLGLKMAFEHYEGTRGE